MKIVVEEADVFTFAQEVHAAVLRGGSVSSRNMARVFLDSKAVPLVVPPVMKIIPKDAGVCAQHLWVTNGDGYTCSKCGRTR